MQIEMKIHNFTLDLHFSHDVPDMCQNENTKENNTCWWFNFHFSCCIFISHFSVPFSSSISMFFFSDLSLCFDFRELHWSAAIRAGGPVSSLEWQELARRSPLDLSSWLLGVPGKELPSEVSTC